MQEIILSRLESARKELLDLGLRNPLLNYKVTKAKGVSIADEESASVYDILVQQQKSMTFLALKEGGLFPAGETKTQDTRLQTNEDEAKLQSRLLNTYYFARTCIEEQGVNLLYLALGFLKWFDGDEPETARLAPLVLVPVSLERSSAQERFRLRYTGGELGANLSLQAKMKTDFNLTIPDIAEPEEFDFDSYIHLLREHIAREANWVIEANAIELGFFSFGKFLIYNDLDTSQWPRSAKPEEHPNIGALLDSGFHEDVAEDEDDLDADTKANELFRVVDADSSQLLAMLAVQDGGNLVIQGPPGTGKSQTITNMIANAVGHGRKVLFVAEKMAALEVVKRRLDNTGLGDLCLELHSHKSNKRELLAELKRVMELGKPQTAKLELEIQMLDSYRNELNDYCRNLNAAIPGTDLTTQQVIGFLLQIQSVTQGKSLVKLAVGDLETWDEARLRLAEEFADRLQARLRDTGMPSELVFQGSKLMLVLEHDKPALLERLLLADRTLAQWLDLLGAIEEATDFVLPQHEEEIPALAALLQLAANAPDLKGLRVNDPVWRTKFQDIQELLDSGEALESVYRTYRDTFIAEAWGQDVLEMRRSFVTHGDKWYRNLNSDYRKSKQALASLLKITLPAGDPEKLKLVDAISEARRLENVLQQYDSFARSLFGERWQKQRSDWHALRVAVEYLGGITDEKVLAYLSRLEPQKAAGDFLLALNELSRFTAETREQALKALLITVFPEKFAEQKGVWETWIERFAELQLTMDWNQLAAQAESRGLGFLVEATAGWDEAHRLLKTCLQKTWYEFLIEKAFTLNKDLVKFERSSHEEVIAKFRRLDEVNLYYNRAKVALRHWEQIPRNAAGGQVNVLKTEFNKRARHMPIRKLVEEAGKAMQALKPVWMMSPLSIANFLPPGSIDFDLVIFDEASQVRPVEAIGAIARGKQLVVVGDTRQLPPTSFFDKLNTDIEEEDNVTADMQSILGLCDGQGAPSRMLRWHYRSRHESLITLSNHEFYEDKLVIFPSPGSRQNLGLRFHHLPQAIYDRGNTRSNPEEAKAVAQAILAHAMSAPSQSLGVVAFSTAQAQAIQAALETERRSNPGSEVFFNARPDEPFFIKNLENVQGDERDVILISIGYGRTEEGKVSLNFGPLTQDGGERRLNVLITRAKLRCEVFTNITAEDIKLAEGSKRGLRTLKSFLYFAQHAKFDNPETIIRDDLRPFEEEVAAQLTKAGHTVRSKVGSPGFYLDLAVVDPVTPGHYLLGIVCDGRAYASAKSTTDRDRLRAQVLELFGWNLYQVWSTDWYRNPARELQRLLEAVEKAKARVNDYDRETAAYKPAMGRDALNAEVDRNPPYELAEIHIEHPREDFNLYRLGEIAEWIGSIVEKESPIHIGEAARRIADAAGLAKVGSRIRYTINQALHQAEQEGKVLTRDEFLWSPELKEAIVRDRSRLPASYKKLALIAPEEIDAAVEKGVKDAIAITEEELIPIVAKMLGFQRVTDEMRQQLSEATGRAIQRGAVTFEGLNLKLPQ